jgi:hypothetical protein
MTINYKWLTFNCVSLFVLAFLVNYYDAATFIWTKDKTHITLVILSLYAACSAYLGYKGGEPEAMKKVRFHLNRFTMLGLMGTMAGLILMFFGASDLDAFRQNILSEVGPVFLTGLFGISASYILDYQIALCFGNYDEA